MIGTEIQIKTTMSHHLTSIMMATIKKNPASIGKDVEKLETLSTVGGNVK